MSKIFENKILNLLQRPFGENSQNWLKNFYGLKASDYLNLLNRKSEIFWQKKAQKKALKIFHRAAMAVPAYKHFLKQHGVEPNQIKTFKDFSFVPIADKQNYIQAYPLRQRCWHGLVPENKIVAMSSGTAASPNYWPRGLFQEMEAALTHELLYTSCFKIHERKTLMIIGFPMGVYVSGAATLLPSWIVAQKYPHLTVLAAGNNKIEVLKAVKNLSADFEQIVLIGHPFFIKDVIETGGKEGVNWKRLKIKMLFCSEGFSEQWREYVMRLAGMNTKDFSAISTYGSSEMLLMAYETPLSIRLRGRLAGKEQTQAWPNLFQYNPLLRYVESVNNELIFTSYSGIPLIRFNLHDSGEIFPFSQGRALIKPSEAKHLKPIWQLPFLSLEGRSDQTIIFYAANIYPQHIHMALNEKKFLGLITGKFAMRKGLLKNMDEFLEINVELKPKIRPSLRLKKNLQDKIFAALLRINSEFQDAHSRFPKKTRPKISLRPYQDKTYFMPGLKPKYIVT